MMLGSIVCLLLLFSLNSISASQPEPSETFTHNAQLEPNGKIHLYWKFNQIHITFEVHGNTNGWVGIGFSPSGSMMGADMNVGWVKNGTATITDRHGVRTGNTYPPLDTEQNVELLGGSECDGWTVLKFRRQLAACDDQDLELTTYTMRVIYAWGLDDPTGDDLSRSDYHTAVRRGAKNLFFEQPNFEQTKYPEGERHFHFDMLNDKFNLPDEDTYYTCKLFKLPELTTKHHLVKIQQIIDNEANVHHMVIYLCTNPNMNDSSVGETARCYTQNMPPGFDSCHRIMYAWAVGGSALYYPTHAGYPLGTPDTPKYISLQIHYDNLLKKSDIVDSSGFRLTYTPDLRQYDAGILLVGVGVSGFLHLIPPNAKSFNSYGECPSECLNYSLGQDGFNSINVFAVMLHSHLLGRQLSLKHIRNGTELAPLASDLTYDFNLQETRVLAEERVVMKGDTLRTVCNCNSVGRTGMTMGGLATYQEMCLSFVYYYPNLALRHCRSSPNFHSLMSYFGFESYSKYAFSLRKNLNDIVVLKPEKYANKTALENLNAMEWNEVKAKKFEKDLLSMSNQVLCYGYGYPQPPPKFQQQTVKIIEPYVVEKLNCTVPSTGFSLTSTTNTCPVQTGPSVAPVTTTSGARGRLNVDWLFLVSVLLAKFVIQY